MEEVQHPNLRSSAIGSKLAAEPFGGFDLGVQLQRLLSRRNQVVAQSLMRAFSMEVLEVLFGGISHCLFTEQNQSIETLRFQGSEETFQVSVHVWL